MAQTQVTDLGVVHVEPMVPHADSTVGLYLGKYLGYVQPVTLLVMEYLWWTTSWEMQAGNMIHVATASPLHAAQGH